MQERRHHPRAQALLPMKLVVGERILETRIKDLSCSGIRFHAPKALQLMSRVQIALELPQGAEGSHMMSLSISGVVVRCDVIGPEDGAAYDTAIFFDDLSDGARSQLSHFVQTRLI